MSNDLVIKMLEPLDNIIHGTHELLQNKIDPWKFAESIFAQALLSRYHIKDVLDYEAIQMGKFKLEISA